MTSFFASNKIIFYFSGFVGFYVLFHTVSHTYNAMYFIMFFFPSFFFLIHFVFPFQFSDHQITGWIDFISDNILFTSCSLWPRQPSTYFHHERWRDHWGPRWLSRESWPSSPVAGSPSTANMSTVGTTSSPATPPPWCSPTSPSDSVCTCQSEILAVKSPCV